MSDRKDPDEKPGWQPELDDLRHRQSLAAELGGADKIARQHAGGRLTVRERIDALADKGSFREIGSIAGRATYDEHGKLKDFTPSNRVMGRAMVGGRPVVITGDDFTVRGGSADATIVMKASYAEQMANETRLPIIRLIEGSGGGGSVKTIETTGRANLPGGLSSSQSWYHLMSENMATIPVVALGLGSVAGLGAGLLTSSHYSVIVKNMSAVFVAGPPVVARIGEKSDLGKQDLGGWRIQCMAGAVDDAVDSEEQAFDAARKFLSYLPSSVHDVSPRGPRTDPPTRSEESLFTAVPRDRTQPYKMRPIVEAIVDKGSFFEMGRWFGRGMITGFARADGVPIAVMASDSFHLGGSWTADVCDKVIRFIDMAETFHLPVLYLCDCPGFAIGLEAERAATIRHGVRAMAAVNQSTVPWCTIIVRNTFGVAGVVHKPAGRLAMRYAWPSAWWGSLPLEGGIEAAYRAELDAADDPKAKLAEIETRLNALRSPLRSAESFWIEEMLDPRDTRKMVCEFANIALPLRTPGRAAFGMRP